MHTKKGGKQRKCETTIYYCVNHVIFSRGLLKQYQIPNCHKLLVSESPLTKIHDRYHNQTVVKIIFNLQNEKRIINLGHIILPR